MTATPSPFGFLHTGGEAADALRSTDWSATPVGSPESWPQTLRDTLGILMHSRHPMFLWWGPELVQFYNDGYLPSFGVGKHPAAMGQRGADCWQEIWPIVWPQIDDVMSHGVPSWNVDQLVPIQRNGHIEDVYWTYGYSPVYLPDGTVGGCLVQCTEVTTRVLAEARMRSLLEATKALAHATGEADVLEMLPRVLGELPCSDVAWSLLLSSSGLGCSASDDAPDPADLRSWLMPRLDEADAGPWRFELPDALRVTSERWAEPVDRLVVASLRHASGVRGHLVVGLNPRIPIDDGPLEFVQALAEQASASIARFASAAVRSRVEGERNSLLMDVPIAAALCTGRDLVFELANPAYQALVAERELIGRPYFEVFPESRGTPIEDILESVYEEGVPYRDEEFRVMGKDPEGAPVEAFFRFALQPVRDSTGNVTGILTLATDVTDQVLARKTLEANQAEREGLLAELKSAIQAKDEFLAMLGHELRNPLAPIRSALDVLKLRGSPSDAGEREVIERQVDHMMGLVDDLLDISRITRGLLELRQERVSLAEVVQRAREQVQPLVDERSHQMTISVPLELEVVGDGRRLAQVVGNLLVNAARYTDEGGRLEVTAREEDDELVMRVVDDGPGLSDVPRETLFEPFVRSADDPSSSGLGLGLAIVKSVVEAHGGRIAVRSPVTERGTEITVRLPMAPQATEPAVASPADEREGVGLRVLLVDDNVDAAEMLSMVLEMQGHDVRVVHHPDRALEVAPDFEPTVALLDIGLPGMDGFELARRLRRLPTCRSTALVALTGFGQPSDRARSAEAGFDAHLVKPVDALEIDRHIRELGAASG